MRLEHYSINKLEREILAIIGKYLDLNFYKVFFFGSRVTGKGSERSDIDVGIEGPQKISANDLLAIQEEVDKIPTLYKIEIVDFNQVAPIFRKVAIQSISFLRS